MWCGLKHLFSPHTSWQVKWSLYKTSLFHFSKFWSSCNFSYFSPSFRPTFFWSNKTDFLSVYIVYCPKRPLPQTGQTNNPRSLSMRISCLFSLLFFGIYTYTLLNNILVYSSADGTTPPHSHLFQTWNLSPCCNFLQVSFLCLGFSVVFISALFT